MAIRVSQRQMFSNFLTGMNKNLGNLMESHLQNTTQKRVNRPSDDPYGIAQILSGNDILSQIKQYKDNLNVANAWLKQADSTLGLVNTELTELFSVMEQASTGTLSSEQRNSLAYKARGILNQLINYSNVRINDRTLFGGHKTTDSAFVAALAITCNDQNMNNVQYKVRGDAASTVVVQFTASGTLGTQPAFRYSNDGGTTWNTGAWNAGPPVTMQAGGVQIEPMGPPGSVITAVDPNNVHESGNGTWMYVRPTAQYMGDGNDAQVVCTYPGNGIGTGTATGVFKRDVAVRIDDIAGGVVTYSYTTDDGSTWTTTTAPHANPSELAIPGGYLSLNNATIGEQYVVHPQRADIDLRIGRDELLTINGVGKDVFGGIYDTPFTINGPQASPADSRNMFEVVSRAIAALECNSQEGAQKALEELRVAMKHVVQYRTDVGARGDRANSARSHLETLELDENDRLSSIEDADIGELLTRLSQQQLAYNSVLKSSSMIMQMNLMNFL